MQDRLELQDFRANYGPWLEERTPLLKAGDFKTAFKGYPFIRPQHTPWTPLNKPLAACTVALVSTAGLYVPGKHAPFDAENIEGDWTYRELPRGADPARMAIAHTHYDHRSVELDRNAVYPMARLEELVQEGVIGDLAARHYSISGYCTRADRVAEETAPAIAEALKADGVDVALHVPV